MTQERWLPIAGFEGLYEVSDQGRVRSHDRVVIRSNGVTELRRGRILKPAREGRGYLFVGLYRDGLRRHCKIHRLVATAFLAPSSSPHVNHIDFDKTNNCASNLEWVTPAENLHHHLHGQVVPAAKSSAAMRAIYVARQAAKNAKPPITRHPKEKNCKVCGSLFAPRPTHRKRAKVCSRQCAVALASWGESRPMAKLSVDDVTRMRDLKASGHSTRSLAAQFGVCIQTAYRALSGKTWKRVASPAIEASIQRQAQEQA